MPSINNNLNANTKSILSVQGHHVSHPTRLFILIAWEVNPRYTIDHCRKVHDEYYKGLDKKLE